MDGPTSDDGTQGESRGKCDVGQRARLAKQCNRQRIPWSWSLDQLRAFVDPVDRLGWDVCERRPSVLLFLSQNTSKGRRFR